MNINLLVGVATAIFDNLIDEPWNNPSWLKENLDRFDNQVLDQVSMYLQESIVSEKDDLNVYKKCSIFAPDSDVGGFIADFCNHDPKGLYYRLYITRLNYRRDNKPVYLSKGWPGSFVQANNTKRSMLNLKKSSVLGFNNWFKINLL